MLTEASSFKNIKIDNRAYFGTQWDSASILNSLAEELPAK